MSNGLPIDDDDSDVGSTFSKNSIAVKVKSNIKDGTDTANAPSIVSNMDEGEPVLYDPAGSMYPKGTNPGLSKDWGDKDERGLATGFDDRLPLPTYLTPGAGPKEAKF